MMMVKVGSLVCVWLLLCESCFAGFDLRKNGLKITSPESMKGVWDCPLETLGLPQHGGTLYATVVYLRANRKGCITYDHFWISLKSTPGALPYILLVDRGDCIFPLKAWNAQKAGAAAILIADDIEGPLISMDTPEESPYQYAGYARNITIPSALINKFLGDSIKKALSAGHLVNIELSWTDAHQGPGPEERVKYEFWVDITSEIGQNGENQIEFIKNFKGVAQIFEQKGYTRFTPHLRTWYCPEALLSSSQCRTRCINHGRYCSPDPHDIWYDGKDVMVQNLRQVCFFEVANEIGKPWLWWDYVTEFATQCSMKNKNCNKYCGDQIIQSLGIDLEKINECIGDPQADLENKVLKAEEGAQIGKGSRGDITVLPTLYINNRQYRGKLKKEAVLNAICAALPKATRARMFNKCGNGVIDDQ